jgi:hypothetical protein
MKKNKTLIVINGTDLNFVHIMIITVAITIIVIVTIIILSSKKKDYNYTNTYCGLNGERKLRWIVLKNELHLSQKQLENCRHYWIVQQNINENSSVSPEVLCQGYSYTWFLSCTKACEVYIKTKKEKEKIVNVSIVPGQSSGVLENSNIVTSII